MPFERWARAVAQPFPLRTWTRPNGIASVLATNLILLAPVLLLLRRWRPPFGSATLLFTTVAVLITVTQEFAHGQLVLAAVAGGLAADWMIAWSSGAVGRTRAHRLVATVTPVALWASYFLVLQLTDGIAWPAELWTGSIIFAGAGWRSAC